MSIPSHHLAFPFRIGRDGRCATPATTEEHVEHELMQLLLTELGERLYAPELGTNLRRMVFEGTDSAAGGLARATIAQAIVRWLGDRLTVEDLAVEVSGGAFEIAIRYRIGGGAPRALRLRRSAP
jgi:phage baseplate assembly protein W